MSLEAATIVLVGTTHSGNIGAVARVMANMGLSRLRLVQPSAAIDAETRARASGADHVLDRATVYDSLRDAISDAVLVVGTTSRRREARRRVFDPASAAAALLRESGSSGRPVAVVFGRESSGLSNAELDFCHGLVSIPVDAAFPSLNLAAAATVVCYELRRHALEPGQSRASADEEDPATAGENEHFFDHLATVLGDLGFTRGSGSEKLMRKIRHLYHRAGPSSEEVSILRGILSAIEQSYRK